MVCFEEGFDGLCGGRSVSTCSGSRLGILAAENGSLMAVEHAHQAWRNDGQARRGDDDRAHASMRALRCAKHALRF